MKRVKPVEDLSASPVRKKGKLAKKVVIVRESGPTRKECEGAGSVSETDRDKSTTSETSKKNEIAMATSEMVKDMECDEQMEEEENSEEEVLSKEEKGSSGKTLSTTSSEVSEEEKARRQIRQRNLLKNKMIRTKRDLKHEEDLTEEDRKYTEGREDFYSHTHIGLKVVEASLIPSRESNNETNKTKMLRYVNGQVYRIVEARESGFGRIDLHFDGYQEANRCFRDKRKGGGDGKVINFTIPNRSKRCKGVISGWGKKATLDELVAR